MTSLSEFTGGVELTKGRKGPSKEIGALSWVNLTGPSRSVHSTNFKNPTVQFRLQRMPFDVTFQNPQKAKLVAEVLDPSVSETCDRLQRSIAEQIQSSWEPDPQNQDGTLKKIMKKMKGMSTEQLMQRKTQDDPQFPLEGTYCNLPTSKKNPETGEPIPGESYAPTMSVKVDCAFPGMTDKDRKRCTQVFYAKQDPTTGEFVQKGIKHGFIWGEGGVADDYTMGPREINAADVLKRGAMITMELVPRPMYARAPSTYGCGWQAKTITVAHEDASADCSAHQTYMQNLLNRSRSRSRSLSPGGDRSRSRSRSRSPEEDEP
tara:strand:- start:553 stop:1509 length:957 start_codon:yes stop_codon:yes gene_type:complete